MSIPEVPGAEGRGLRIAVIGLSGSGKSTCAGLIEEFAADRGLSHARVKLARPLYELQSLVYRTAGVGLAADAQDQALMEALAEALRRINPRSMVDDFLRRLAAVSADVIVNDDLRDPHVDAVELRRNGFRILRITCDEELRQRRVIRRGDLTRSQRSTRRLDLIEPDAVIANDSSLAAYRARVHRILEGWL